MVLPDLLGSGDSAKPDAQYTLQEHLSPLADLVAHEGWPEPLFVGGHSLGCLLATALAAALPEGRVRGLVFLNYPRFTSGAHVHRTLRAGSREYRQATEGVPGGDSRSLIEASGAMVSEFAALLPEALQEEARRTPSAALAGTTRHCLFAYAPDPDLDCVAGLPMLLLHGALDRVAPASSIWERKADFPNARWVILKDAGHHLLHTHTGKAVEEIRGFLEAASRPSV
jgi:pimeloyl-ACP methyl ester carboxylesterase